MIGLDLCPSSGSRDAKARSCQNPPSVFILLIGRNGARRGGRREREGEEEKISCQLFLHKILDFSLL